MWHFDKTVTHLFLTVLEIYYFYVLNLNDQLVAKLFIALSGMGGGILEISCGVVSGINFTITCSVYLSVW